MPARKTAIQVKRPTKRQQEAVQTYLQAGNYADTGQALGITKQGAHELVQTALTRIDLDAFQEEHNRAFVVKTWRIIGKCEDLLERKIDLLLDTDKLEKEDASKLSRVIYDLRRSMQSAVAYVQLSIQRNIEANSTGTDLEGEAIDFLCEKYGKERGRLLAFLTAS